MYYDICWRNVFETELLLAQVALRTQYVAQVSLRLSSVLVLPLGAEVTDMLQTIFKTRVFGIMLKESVCVEYSGINAQETELVFQLYCDL